MKFNGVENLTMSKQKQIAFCEMETTNDTGNSFYTVLLHFTGVSDLET